MITSASAAGAVGAALTGWTVAVKDLIDVAGVLTTAGGARAGIARRDATVVSRLRKAGVTVMGKANMDEWGLGVTGRNATWGDCRNPWDPARISGGSSAGSAAAVAAGMATIGLGTDSAGSLRIPAALCGVTALKPGHGLIPMAGVLGLAPNLDVIGPIARSVTDCARTWAAIGPRPAAPVAGAQRVGIPRGEHWATVDHNVGQALERTARQLERDGFRLIEVEVPAIGEATRLAGVVLLYELAHRHGRRWRAEGLQLDRRVARQLDLGAATSRADYLGALAFRDRWRAQLAKLFESIDVMLHATTSAVAPLASERVTTAGLTRLCAAWNLAGLPVLAMPTGVGRGDMPIGGSLVGRAGDEALLLELGMAYQRRTEWHRRVPAQV